MAQVDALIKTAKEYKESQGVQRKTKMLNAVRVNQVRERAAAKAVLSPTCRLREAV